MSTDAFEYDHVKTDSRSQFVYSHLPLTYRVKHEGQKYALKVSEFLNFGIFDSRIPMVDDKPMFIFKAKTWWASGGGWWIGVRYQTEETELQGPFNTYEEVLVYLTLSM